MNATGWPPLPEHALYSNYVNGQIHVACDRVARAERCLDNERMDLAARIEAAESLLNEAGELLLLYNEASDLTNGCRGKILNISARIRDLRQSQNDPMITS